MNKRGERRQNGDETKVLPLLPQKRESSVKSAVTLQDAVRHVLSQSGELKLVLSF